MQCVSVALMGAAVIFFCWLSAFMLQEYTNNVKCIERNGIYVQGFFSGECFERDKIISLEDRR